MHLLPEEAEFQRRFTALRTKDCGRAGDMHSVSWMKTIGRLLRKKRAFFFFEKSNCKTYEGVASFIQKVNSPENNGAVCVNVYGWRWQSLSMEYPFPKRATAARNGYVEGEEGWQEYPTVHRQWVKANRRKGKSREYLLCMHPNYLFKEEKHFNQKRDKRSFEKTMHKDCSCVSRKKTEQKNSILRFAAIFAAI